MPEPPPLVPPDLEVARDIPDRQMVFRSNEDTPSTKSTKAVKLKAAKARLKVRKSTPTPPTKGDGLKRLDLSPFPEDKQLRKKLSFGGEDNPAGDTPRCKMAIFPAISGSEDEVKEKPAEGFDPTPDENVKEVLKKHDRKGVVGEAPVSGQDHGGTTKYNGKTEAVLSHASPMVVGAPCDVLVPLEVGEATLPKREESTKVVLESAFVPYSSSMARDVSLDFPPMQPKVDEILHLAALDSAERLDVAAAQPLLAGTPREGAFKPSKSPQWPTGCIKNVSHTIGENNGPSLEDFPPLERGRTRKIRDSFEAGSKHDEAIVQPTPSPKPNPPRDVHGPTEASKASPCSKPNEVMGEPSRTKPCRMKVIKMTT